MTRDEFRTMLVPASRVTECRAMADAWPGGVGMFITPLRNKETGELTHYLSSGLIDATIATQMPWSDYSTGVEIRHDGDIPALVDSINSQHPEAEVTVEYITELCSECDISTQEWREAAERLNLELGGSQ